MMKYLRWVILLLVVMGLIASFWFSQGWLQLCAGLAIFLFGMQCLEDGLRQLAGSKLEQILGRSTSTPFKSLLFGVGGTLLLPAVGIVERQVFGNVAQRKPKPFAAQDQDQPRRMRVRLGMIGGFHARLRQAPNWGRPRRRKPWPGFARRCTSTIRQSCASSAGSAAC